MALLKSLVYSLEGRSVDVEMFVDLRTSLMKERVLQGYVPLMDLLGSVRRGQLDSNGYRVDLSEARRRNPNVSSEIAALERSLREYDENDPLRKVVEEARESGRSVREALAYARSPHRITSKVSIVS